jgi:VanZ family protein
LTVNRFLRALCVASWIGVLCWAAVIFICSETTGEKLEELNVWHVWDKAGHFIAFGAGGVLLALAFSLAFAWKPGVIFRRAVLILAIYGASDEIHQYHTPGRSAGDWRDWLADLLGSSAGAGLVVLARRKRQSVKACEAPLPE